MKEKEENKKEEEKVKCLSCGPHFPADAIPEQPSRGQATHTKSLTSGAENPLQRVVH